MQPVVLTSEPIDRTTGKRSYKIRRVCIIGIVGCIFCIGFCSHYSICKKKMSMKKTNSSQRVRYYLTLCHKVSWKYFMQLQYPLQKPIQNMQPIIPIIPTGRILCLLLSMTGTCLNVFQEPDWKTAATRRLAVRLCFTPLCIMKAQLRALLKSLEHYSTMVLKNSWWLIIGLPLCRYTLLSFRH